MDLLKLMERDVPRGDLLMSMVSITDHVRTGDGLKTLPLGFNAVAHKHLVFRIESHASGVDVLERVRVQIELPLVENMLDGEVVTPERAMALPFSTVLNTPNGTKVLSTDRRQFVPYWDLRKTAAGMVQEITVTPEYGNAFAVPGSVMRYQSLSKNSFEFEIPAVGPGSRVDLKLNPDVTQSICNKSGLGGLSITDGNQSLETRLSTQEASVRLVWEYKTHAQLEKSYFLQQKLVRLQPQIPDSTCLQIPEPHMHEHRLIRLYCSDAKQIEAVILNGKVSVLPHPEYTLEINLQQLESFHVITTMEDTIVFALVQEMDDDEQ